MKSWSLIGFLLGVLLDQVQIDKLGSENGMKEPHCRANIRWQSPSQLDEEGTAAVVGHQCDVLKAQTF